jgi:hypothetical protein
LPIVNFDCQPLNRQLAIDKRQLNGWPTPAAFHAEGNTDSANRARFNDPKANATRLLLATFFKFAPFTLIRCAALPSRHFDPIGTEFL